jgi:alpha-glucosidase
MKHGMIIGLMLFIALFSSSLLGYTQSNPRVSSPDAHRQLVLTMDNGVPELTYLYDDFPLMEHVRLGLQLKGFAAPVYSLQASSTARVDTSWNTVWGAQTRIRNTYNEMKLELKDASSALPLWVYVRVYNDGWAFRYEIPAQQTVKNITVVSEYSSFTFREQQQAWWIQADDESVEKLYQQTPMADAKHVAVPFTVKSNTGFYTSVLEAAVTQYTTMTLKQDSANPQRYTVRLVPWADGDAVKAGMYVRSPWRVFVSTLRAADLMNSNIVLNLNEANQLKNTSWIRPMTYLGIWWEMHLGLSTWAPGARHGATTANAKRYIDFCSQQGVRGLLIEGWNTGWDKWGQEKAFDYVTPSADFNLKEVVTYARLKGVEIIGHLETGGDVPGFEKMAEKAFKKYHELGVRVVKLGYAGAIRPLGEKHHGQYMVEHLQRVTEWAAQNEIMLSVHEPVVPSGLQRTWPNLMTFEGVRGMEWNAWSEGNPPSHTATIPFVRGLAGPVDYTPGIFDLDYSLKAAQRVKWNDQQKGPTAGHSTLMNQLALMYVLYSPLQMAADLPENYKDHPAFKLVRELPTTWDESKTLEGEIGEYAIVARRKGDVWYVAGINGLFSKEIVFKLDFLEAGFEWDGIIYSDTPESHYDNNPEAYAINTFPMTWEEMGMTMMAGGGFVMKITKRAK